MSRFFEIVGQKISVFGDTYTVRDQIKELGGRWQSAEKKWILPHEPKATEKLLQLGFSAVSSSADSLLPKISEKLESVENSHFSATSPLALPDKIWTTSEFLAQFAFAVRANCPQEFWIQGEIFGLKVSSGHFYFDCTDIASESSHLPTSFSFKPISVSCLLWKGKVSALQAQGKMLPLEDGMKVKLFVQTEVRKNEAKVNLVVQDIDAQFTLGALTQSRSALVAELKKRNLYNANKTKGISLFPLRIALLTSHKSRAETDFIHELQLSGLSFSTTVFDCAMQGENTAKSICAAFENIRNHTDFHVVVIARGGGSKLDLRWFDNLEICKEIAYCNLAVVSAIGHTDDVSVADEVSWRAEKTPTGAARFLVGCVQNSWQNLTESCERTALKCAKNIGRKQENLNVIQTKFQTTALNNFSRKKQKLAHLQQALRLAHTAQLSPMKRGFAITTPSQFQQLKELKEGETLRVTREEARLNGEIEIAEVHATVLKVHLKTVQRNRNQNDV